MQLLDNMSIPAFLSKLRKMVDDPKTDNLICWSNDGKSFIIRNEVEFWYSLLPAYYKHNNMSSFVRQLNMYGFHKISNLDNGTTENDRGEYQFFHPYFQKAEPPLMKMIKRKVTHSKVVPADNPVPNIEGEVQINKVFTDVRNLQSRQNKVDSVLNNLKQENAVLWRELAVLRQKHQKQQQIVNKLIQFLVTIVQPSSRMGGLGVKRRYPLMINENPVKKQKPSTSDGPIIHELDNAEVLPEEIFEEAEIEEPLSTGAATLDAATEQVVQSPPSTSQQPDPPLLLNGMDDTQTVEPEMIPGSYLKMDKQPNEVTVDSLLTDPGISDEAANISCLELGDEFVDAEEALMDADDTDKVFLNSQSQDTLLSNLLNGSYNGNVLNGNRNTTVAKKDNANATSTSASTSSDMTVATRDPTLAVSKRNAAGTEHKQFKIDEHIDNHIGSTHNELEQLKEFFRGCNGIDTSYLLNLFSDAPSYGLTSNQELGDDMVDTDFLSGSELAPYDPSKVDFNELLDDSTDLSDLIKPELVLENSNESLHTPETSNLKPFLFDNMPDDNK